MTADKPPRDARLRSVVIAGHTADPIVANAHLDDPEPAIRAAALGALDRLGVLSDEVIAQAGLDPAPSVRRRVTELAATRPTISLLDLLHDDDSSVVESAAWACGEQSDLAQPVDAIIEALIAITTGAPDALAREAAAAALGAIGDPRGLPAILVACADKPHVRRRAVLALAPFEGDEVEAAIDRALADRDWQVRQSAEDLRRASGHFDSATE